MQREDHIAGARTGDRAGQCEEGQVGRHHHGVAMSEVRYPRDAIDEGQADGRERVEAADDQSDDELRRLGHRGPSGEGRNQ